MKKIVAVIMAMVLCLAFFAGCAETEVFAAEKSDIDYSKTALRIGDMEFSVNDVNFMYVGLFNQMYSSLVSYYGDYLSSIIDITKPLEEQMLDESTTWHQYIMDYCVDSFITNTAAYKAAKADPDFVIPEEYQTDLDTLEEQFVKIAEESGYTLEEYLEFMYGKGINFETVYKMTEFQYVAYAYQDMYYNNVPVSEEEMREYYKENRNDLDTVNFRYYSAIYGEEGGTLTEEEAKAQAEALEKVHTAEEFNALVYEFVDEERKTYFENGDATIYPDAKYADTGIEEVSAWLFDDARVYGDTMIYFDEAHKSYLVVMFEERASADYNFIDVRHILIVPEKAEDGTSDDAAWAAAKAKAEEILNGYLEGEMTEEAFSILAQEHSADGNASLGGIYENIYKGKMVDEFEDWCFDEARQEGDTGIVETQYGYHIMYFCGLGDSNLSASVKPIIAENVFNSWMENLRSELTVEKLPVLESCGGMIDDIVNAAAEEGENNNSEEEKTEEEPKSYTGIIIGVLVAVIIVCIVIIIKNGKKKDVKPEEKSEEATEEESVLEATDEDLTEEELLAEEAFEENASEENSEENVSEETSEE